MIDQAKIIKKSIVEIFSNSEIVERYKELAKKGLTRSEEEFFVKYCKKGFQVLDIGCGTGRVTIRLSEMGYKVIGLDISLKMLQAAQELVKETIKGDFVMGNARQLPFIEHSFNNVSLVGGAWNTILGKKERLIVLKEIYHVLKRDGKFILTCFTLKKFGVIWWKSWIKLYIFNKLGFKVNEKEFGEVYGKKRGVVSYFPLIPKIKEELTKAGFNLEVIKQLPKSETHIQGTFVVALACVKP